MLKSILKVTGLLTVFGIVLPHAQNLITNGNFESGGTGFYLYVKDDEGATGAATVSYTGGGYNTANAANVNVTATSSQNWHIQLQAPHNWVPVAQTEYQLSFWAKGPEGASVHIGLSDANYGYILGSNITLSSTYQKYNMTIFSADYDKIRINFYLASQTGTYTIDEIELTQGQTLTSEWFSDHESRIDTLRAATKQVQFVKDGSPIKDATVHVELKRHEFPFGTALNFAGGADEEWYKATAAKHFWAGVNENAFKWPSFEYTEGVINDTEVNATLAFAEENDWVLMRGHALEWGIENWGFANHWARSGTCEEYKTALKHRIDRDLATYKGKFQHYDVWNEVFHETAMFDKCGDDLLDSAYHWARKADPSAILTINEYQIISGGMTATYIDVIRGMIQRGVPLDAIGVQAHFTDADTINPAVVKARLDQLSEFNLPIFITEFDMGKWDGNAGTNDQTLEVQAKEYAKMVRIAFSHPSVEAFMMWGFWDSRHWVGGGTNGGGIYDENKNPKPAADSLNYLWKELWHSSYTGLTDANGTVTLKAFHGKYSYSITVDGIIYEGTVDLPKGVNSASINPVSGEVITNAENHSLDLPTKAQQGYFNMKGQKVSEPMQNFERKTIVAK